MGDSPKLVSGWKVEGGEKEKKEEEKRKKKKTNKQTIVDGEQIVGEKLMNRNDKELAHFLFITDFHIN